MKNKNVSQENVKIESVNEYLERGGEITEVPTKRRNRTSTGARPKLYNRRKHSPRPQFISNPIY